MDKMQIVIELSDESYDKVINPDNWYNPSNAIKDIVNAIREGTTLPKGHGRLGDLDKLIRIMKDRDEDNGGEPLNAVDRGYHLAYEHLCEEIDNLLKENEDGNVD